MGNEDHCPTDSNSHRIQCFRWERGTTVLLILILTVLSVSAGNEDHCHAYSNSHSIQCIRQETKTTVIPILILTIFSESDGKRGLLLYRF